MGVYTRCIFPFLVDRALSRGPVIDQRRLLLANVHGEVLEIGFGTGLNLPHYPHRVQRLTVIDPNPGMLRRAARRIAQSGIEVRHVQSLNDRDLPLPDDSFDSVVSTWTLCSVRDLSHMLNEIYRVLKPGGRFYFLEHGLCPEPRIATWQRRLTPIQKRLGDGCHLDRDIASAIRSSQLKIDRLENFYLPGVLKIDGYMYRGVAVK